MEIVQMTILGVGDINVAMLIYKSSLYFLELPFNREITISYLR